MTRTPYAAQIVENLRATDGIIIVSQRTAGQHPLLAPFAEAFETLRYLATIRLSAELIVKRKKNG